MMTRPTAFPARFSASMLGAVLLAGALLLTTFSAPAGAGLVDSVRAVKPAVVAVGTYQRTRSPAFQFRGTGFVVGDGRHIVTNAHVLPEVLAGEQMETLVVVSPGEELSGKVRPVRRLLSEPARDLAVLTLEGGEALPALRLASVQKTVAEGQEIAFTGFPIGTVLGITPVTHRGIISAITPIGIPQGNARDLKPALVRRLGNDLFRVYQLDATAYPGSSGSPVYDPDSGEVIAVINMVLVKSTKESVLSDPSGVTYAIPVEHLHTLLERVGK